MSTTESIQSQGRLSVHTENLFPIIKKFLYSDHEIFLRELISNATDATTKLSKLYSTGAVDGEQAEPKISVTLDKEAKTLTFTDAGLGMTAEEVDKYINQIASSSAEEFVKRFADAGEKADIIGHFGLGFYSAFMVADKVEIHSLSYQPDAQPVHWVCEGSTTYTLSQGTRTEIGTDVILHISEEGDEFLESARIKTLLDKYCKYLPIPITFEDEVINSKPPLWMAKPSEVTEEQYKEFYKDLYPFAADPLFWIHLNVDYPFNLTGILYFPHISTNLELEKNKIGLYSNQVFVTDNVEAIVPQFLTLLHGVIDSPDIPLNVSRSYLQADSNVKKISSYIVKKIADKIEDWFKNDREAFTAKWNDIGIIIKYGCLTDEKFAQRAKEFTLVQDLGGNYYTPSEYNELIKENQKDEQDNHIWLYTWDKQAGYSYSAAAQQKGYNVLVFDHPIDSHYIGWLERGFENVQLKRVDAGPTHELIKKSDVEGESILSQDAQDNLKSILEELGKNDKFTVEVKALGASDPAAQLVQEEWMRRFRDMSKMSGGAISDMGMPAGYTLVVNSNSPAVSRIAQLEDATLQKEKIAHLADLAMLGAGILQGERLAKFMQRAQDAL